MVHIIGLSEDKSFVIAESDLSDANKAVTELRDMGARHKAIQYAAEHGIIMPACGMLGSHYPVDDKGEVVGDPRTQKTHRYRIDIPITSRIR